VLPSWLGAGGGLPDALHSLFLEGCAALCLFPGQSAHWRASKHFLDMLDQLLITCAKTGQGCAKLPIFAVCEHMHGTKTRFSGIFDGKLHSPDGRPCSLLD